MTVRVEYKLSEYWPGGKWQVFNEEGELVDEFQEEWEVLKYYPDALKV